MQAITLSTVDLDPIGGAPEPLNVAWFDADGNALHRPTARYDRDRTEWVFGSRERRDYDIAAFRAAKALRLVAGPTAYGNRAGRTDAALACDVCEINYVDEEEVERLAIENGATPDVYDVEFVRGDVMTDAASVPGFKFDDGSFVAFNGTADEDEFGDLARDILDDERIECAEAGV